MFSKLKIEKILAKYIQLYCRVHEFLRLSLYLPYVLRSSAIDILCLLYFRCATVLLTIILLSSMIEAQFSFRVSNYMIIETYFCIKLDKSSIDSHSYTSPIRAHSCTRFSMRNKWKAYHRCYPFTVRKLHNVNVSGTYEIV